MGSYARQNYSAPPAEAYQKIYDYDGSGNLTYEGWSTPGQAASAATWAIKRYTYSEGRLIAEQWANGNTDALNVWNDRAGLSYA